MPARNSPVHRPGNYLLSNGTNGQSLSHPPGQSRVPQPDKNSRSARRPVEPQPPRRPPQTTRPIALLPFQGLAELIGAQLAQTAAIARQVPRQLGQRLIETVQALLDEHLGHVADRAGLRLRHCSEPFAEFFRQHHLDTWRLGAAAGGGLTGGHGPRVRLLYTRVYRGAQG